MIGGYEDNNYIGATWVFTRNTQCVGTTGRETRGDGVCQWSRLRLPRLFSLTCLHCWQCLCYWWYDDNSDAGAAWVFSFNGATWSQVGAKLVGAGASGAAHQGIGVAISADAITIAVGGYNDASRQVQCGYSLSTAQGCIHNKGTNSQPLLPPLTLASLSHCHLMDPLSSLVHMETTAILEPCLCLHSQVCIRFILF